ncbi:PEPxxWA-CTERM sorting domain-containing protein [Sphingomonas sp. RS6]
MKHVIVRAAAAALAAGWAMPALAQDYYVFGYSPSGAQTLSVNGGGAIQAAQTGWFDQTGGHSYGNDNYLTGTVGESTFRSYYTFVLNGPITSGVVSIGNSVDWFFPGLYNGTSGNLMLTLYDVTSAINTYQEYDGAIGIYDDLGSGTVLGSVLISAAASSYVITLNEAGVAAANAAYYSASAFTFGASLTPATSGVPEPAAWAMLLGGFGLMGGALRRRNQRVTVRYA